MKSRSLVTDIALLVGIGWMLGLGYNALGVQEGNDWGLAWKGVDRVEELLNTPEVLAVEVEEDAAEASSDPYSVDPLAAPALRVERKTLPEIPDYGRPVQIGLAAVKQLHDADAALFIDARERWEYDEGHITGAISLPHEEAITDPARLEQLDTGGKPVVTYCGGGSCEISLSLAYELLGNGHAHIAVYMGGFPEWQQAGYPVDAAGDDR